MSATASTSSDRLITLSSSDDVEFMVTRKAIRRCLTIEKTVQHLKMDIVGNAGKMIRISKVNAETLKLVFEYCEHEINTPIMTERSQNKAKLSEWVKGFLDVDQKTLFDLINAATYLKCYCLLNATCQGVADMIKGKSPEEIRRLYNIENDLTPEQEDQIKRSDAKLGFPN